jgi:hypothetical protein
MYTISENVVRASWFSKREIKIFPGAVHTYVIPELKSEAEESQV